MVTALPVAAFFIALFIVCILGFAADFEFKRDPTAPAVAQAEWVPYMRSRLV